MKVTIKQAADALSVSEVTIRRRIKRGELTAVKQDTPQGFVWLVNLPDIGVDEGSPTQTVSSVTDQPPTQSGDHDYATTTQPSDQRLITELENQVAWLKAELDDRKREHDRDRDDWRNELERLHTLMAQQGQTLQALSATAGTPQAEQQEPQTTPEPESVPMAPESPSANEAPREGIWPWLRRLLGG